MPAPSVRLQLAWVHSCYAFIGLFGIGFVLIAGFLPPPRPTDSATEVARAIAENAESIRLGMVVCVAASALLLPWGAAVAAQIRSVERDHYPLLTYTWLSANSILTILFVYCCLWWTVAAFRPQADPDVIQGHNDMAWLGFFGIIATALVQCLTLAVATFRDPRPDPVYPRWFGYFQLWCLVGLTPDLFVFYFKSGPLAWNGLLACWLELAVAAAWLVVTTVLTANAINNPEPLTVAALSIEDRLTALEHSQTTRSEKPST